MTWSYFYVYKCVLMSIDEGLVYIKEVIFTYLVMYELGVQSCRLIIGILSMWEDMGLHMYIIRVDLDWDHE